HELHETTVAVSPDRAWLYRVLWALTHCAPARVAQGKTEYDKLVQKTGGLPSPDAYRYAKLGAEVVDDEDEDDDDARFPDKELNRSKSFSASSGGANRAMTAFNIAGGPALDVPPTEITSKEDRANIKHHNHKPRLKFKVAPRFWTFQSEPLPHFHSRLVFELARADAVKQAKLKMERSSRSCQPGSCKRGGVKGGLSDSSRARTSKRRSHDGQDEDDDVEKNEPFLVNTLKDAVRGIKLRPAQSSTFVGPLWINSAQRQGESQEPAQVEKFITAALQNDISSRPEQDPRRMQLKKALQNIRNFYESDFGVPREFLQPTGGQRDAEQASATSAPQKTKKEKDFEINMTIDANCVKKRLAWWDRLRTLDD
ncbi:unnamed protein product, partial [Amoebophrya sp. A120]